MYLDKIDLKCTGDASAVYKAAVKYCMPHLCEVTARYMVRDMNIDSLWPVLQLAAEIQESVLKDECAKVMDHVRMHAVMKITENTGNIICASEATSMVTWCHNTGNRI
jgi:queuine/archaeosine tRNA-ribosyltransferase